MNNKAIKTKGIVNRAWETIEDGYNKYHKNYPSLIFHKESQMDFINIFTEKYEEIMHRFMKSETNALDSHKQAALLTISCLEANVIEHDLKNQNQISIIPQIIALNVGLSYMKNCLNDILKEKKIGKSIEKYYLPVAIACNTPYEEIICRILYHEQNEPDMSFNVLELADKFFLIEYINLLQHGIEPYLLKDE